jgi:hypothetical protein
MAVVTHHAAERYVERIAPGTSITSAYFAIMASAETIDIAAAFGAREVRTPRGARLVLEGDTVVTVKQTVKDRSAPGAMVKRWVKEKRTKREREA